MWQCKFWREWFFTHQITPHPTLLHGQGQISANFSASLEFTHLEMRSSKISDKNGNNQLSDGKSNVAFQEHLIHHGITLK